MAKRDFQELLKKAKLNNKEKVLQKVVPDVSEQKKNDEVAFLFRIERELLKKIKRKALEEETSVKQLLVKAIKAML